MDTQRLEILPGGQLLLFGKLLWQASHKEQRVGLLDHLIPLEPVKADLMIAGLVTGFELCRINAFQQVEGIVLAIASSDRIPGKLDRIAQYFPSAVLRFRHTQGLILLRGFLFQPRSGGERQREVVLYHGIGEQIVAGNAAVFIRTFAEQQIDLPRFQGGRVAADPEASCFHQYLCAALEEKAVIAGPIQVLAQSIGHVSGEDTIQG